VDDAGMAAAIRIRSVHKSVVEGQVARCILDGVDLEVGRGESVAVLGRSGSGKSTLLHLIAGLDTADSGIIEVCGDPVTGVDEAARTQARQRHVGFVFQAFHLLPTLTLSENIALPLELAGVSAADGRRRAGQLLDLVGLADRSGAFPAVLSGGEQQRVAVARALAHEPAVILADEPTGNLDDDSAAIVLDLLLQLQRQARGAMVLVTHSREAAERCDRTLRLEHGRLQA
jgi:putative ABC transport system ATP-binding protein